MPPAKHNLTKDRAIVLSTILLHSECAFLLNADISWTLPLCFSSLKVVSYDNMMWYFWQHPFIFNSECTGLVDTSNRKIRKSN